MSPIEAATEIKAKEVQTATLIENGIQPDLISRQAPRNRAKSNEKHPHCVHHLQNVPTRLWA
jgi:hypothetical protein